jgi:hypothetical protein
VSDSTDQRKLRNQKGERRKVTSNPVRAKRIFAVTTLVGGGTRECHYITENSYIKEHENGLLVHKPHVQNISVFVNPFSSATTSSNCNDSAPENDLTVFSDRKMTAAHEYLRTATRFHEIKTGGEIGREEKPADILDSFSRKESDPNISKCEAGFQTVQGVAGGYEERDEGGEFFCDSDVNGRLEVVNGVVHRWSAEDDVLGELEESTTAEEFFGSGAFSSGDSSSVTKDSSVILVQEILQDVLHMVVSQCSEGRQVSNAGIIMDG